MSIIDTLITDRAEADVGRAAELSAKGLLGMTSEERAEYLSGLKGAYNATDLNRVAEAMEYVAERLRGYGYRVELPPQRRWTRTDFPTPEAMERYTADLAALRRVISLPLTTPPVPVVGQGKDWMSVQEANDIERILADIDRILTNAAAAFRHCGAAICGGGGLLVR